MHCIARRRRENFCDFRASLWRFVRQKRALQASLGGFHPSKYCRKWRFLKGFTTKIPKNFGLRPTFLDYPPPLLRIGANKGGFNPRGGLIQGTQLMQPLMFVKQKPLELTEIRKHTKKKWDSVYTDNFGLGNIKYIIFGAIQNTFCNF